MEWQLVDMFTERPVLSQYDIEQSTVYDQSAISRLTSRWAHEKILSKSSHKLDKRHTLLTLLPKGEKLFSIIKALVFPARRRDSKNTSEVITVGVLNLKETEKKIKEFFPSFSPDTEALAAYHAGEVVALQCSAQNKKGHSCFFVSELEITLKIRVVEAFHLYLEGEKTSR